MHQKVLNLVFIIYLLLTGEVTFPEICANHLYPEHLLHPLLTHDTIFTAITHFPQRVLTSRYSLALRRCHWVSAYLTESPVSHVYAEIEAGRKVLSHPRKEPTESSSSLLLTPHFLPLLSADQQI